MFPCCLYCVYYWFLGNAERGMPKFPKSQKQFPRILGEFLGTSWGMHNLALIVLVFSPSSCWRCCPQHTGVVAIVVMLPLPSSCWHLCCCCSGLFAVIELALCAGTVGLITLELLPLLPTRLASQLKRRTCARWQAAPSGASAAPTTPNASARSPFRRIVIVGAPVKVLMLTTNKRWN